MSGDRRKSIPIYFIRVVEGWLRETIEDMIPICYGGIEYGYH